MKTPHALLVCHVGSVEGVGHLSRLLALAKILRKDGNVISEFLIFGDFIKKDDLANFNVHAFSIKEDFVSTIKNFLSINTFNVIIFDLYPRHNISNLDKLLIQLNFKFII